MLFYRLNATSYQPEMIIEKYSSLIWTERYRVAGDFELKTTDVASTMSKLPLGSLVSHLDTKAVSIVESFEIGRNKNNEDVLTVAGRSATTILESRAAVEDGRILNDPATGEPYVWQITSTPSATATTIIRDHIFTGVVDVKDKIPSADVTTSGLGTETSATRQIARGDLYTAVQSLLEESNLGLRVHRPPFGGTGVMFFTVYLGMDKTDTVIFNSDNGDFVTLKYFTSIKDYKTTVYGTAPRVYSNLSRSGTSSLTGFSRRSILNDNSDIKALNTTIEGQILTARNKSVLGKTGVVKLFDCEVSPDISYRYSQDYSLGDQVHCIGPYGIVLDMMVTEYIRVEDEKGDRGFPGLSQY